MNIINFSAETNQGPFLNINEDGYDFSFESDLYMIFDGFGGNGVGDKAVAELKKNIAQFYQNFVQDRNATLPFFYSPKYLLEGNALVNSAIYSHHELYKKNLETDVSKRGGASAILAAKSESIISLLNVGNCRAYLVRRGKIISIFSEDSFRFLTHDKYESHLKNVPLAGFGLFPDLQYQIREVRVAKGDKLLLLSDGVYGRLDDEELQSGIDRESLNIKIKIHELFDLANNRGNLDNQTCMIFEF
ncbi:MAG: SpoIIE family protein phosphatase [Flavobacteriaceae bacterium]|nr:SpoIIE family protein phosphatase [Flavobacteriaceae bacterium]